VRKTIEHFKKNKKLTVVRQIDEENHCLEFLQTALLLQSFKYASL